MKRFATLLSAAVLAAGLWALPAMGMVAISPRPPGPAPVGWAYTYVSPVFQTVTDRIWIPERVQMIADWMQVSPGQWQQVYRQVVTPGHYELTTRQVQVSAGYWQLVRVDPMPIPMPLPRRVVVNPGSVGVDGYSSGTGEDLSKFSGLSEWPK